jgi:hypothetical protein
MLAAALGVLGVQAARNPKAALGLAGRAFKLGTSSVEGVAGASKRLKNFHSPSHTAVKLGVGAVGAYGGYQVGGVAGDFAGQAHLAYEGETESSLALASFMGTAGRLGGALLGGGLAIGAGKAFAPGGPGSAKVVAAAEAKAAKKAAAKARVSPDAVSKRVNERRAARQRILKENRHKDISGVRPRYGQAHPYYMTDEYLNDIKRVNDYHNRAAVTARAAERANGKDILKRARKMGKFGGKKSAVKKQNLIMTSLKGNATKLAPFLTTDLRFGLAGIGAGAVGGLGAEAARPTHRVASEGFITGISSSPTGGISPELQMSTQGLTLGIHNRRKQRII